MESIDYILNYLLMENPKIRLKQDAITPQEKFNLYRSLCNIRPANKISEEYVQYEKKYLTWINNKKTITDMEDIETTDKTHPNNNLDNDDKIALWQGDITTLNIGAIVNAANSQGLGCFVPGHNCIDNQIHTFAGIPLRLECNEYMKTINYDLPTGEAFITGAYNLPSEHIIHTVGPIIERSVTDKKRELLAECYTNCLKTAQENNVKSIAFCSISTGVFRFPKDIASQIALRTVDGYLSDYGECFDKIVFNLYSDEDVKIYEESVTTH